MTRPQVSARAAQALAAAQQAVQAEQADIKSSIPPKAEHNCDHATVSNMSREEARQQVENLLSQLELDIGAAFILDWMNTIQWGPSLEHATQLLEVWNNRTALKDGHLFARHNAYRNTYHQTTEPKLVLTNLLASLQGSGSPFNLLIHLDEEITVQNHHFGLELLTVSFRNMHYRVEHHTRVIHGIQNTLESLTGLSYVFQVGNSSRVEYGPSDDVATRLMHHRHHAAPPNATQLHWFAKPDQIQKAQQDRDSNIVAMYEHIDSLRRAGVNFSLLWMQEGDSFARFHFDGQPNEYVAYNELLENFSEQLAEYLVANCKS